MVTRVPNPPFNARRLEGGTLVVTGLTNAGFVDGLVIDTGDDVAPYALADVDRVVITHGHADHFAVAHDLRATGARIAASRDDASLVENPDINIRGMFSWARPGDMLVTRLFKGEPCEVDEYLEDWRDERAEIIPLPGHTIGHCGVLTRDGVLFSGDALYPEPLWEQHPLPYCADPLQAASSLERMRGVACSWIVPGHGTPLERAVAETHIDYHLGEIRAIETLILDRLEKPHTTEQAIAMISAERGLPETPASYWLAVTTVKGFLGALLDREELEFAVRDHAGWWVRV